jgi:hypothetical protein
MHGGMHGGVCTGGLARQPCRHVLVVLQPCGCSGTDRRRGRFADVSGKMDKSELARHESVIELSPYHNSRAECISLLSCCLLTGHGCV